MPITYEEVPSADGAGMTVEVDAFVGVEVQVCAITKTVQFMAWDHGNGEPPEWLNQQSAAISLDEAKRLVDWLDKAITAVEHPRAA